MGKNKIPNLRNVIHCQEAPPVQRNALDLTRSNKVAYKVIESGKQIQPASEYTYT